MIRGLARLALTALLLATAARAHAAHVLNELPPLALTAEQRATLAKHPTLRLGVETAWAPIEFVDTNGVYSGVVSSYMHALEQELGVHFQIVQKASFADVLSAFENGEIDVLSSLSKTEQRASMMRFTDPYVMFTNGIIVRNAEPYIERLGDLPDGKRLAVVQGYSSNERAAADHPQLVVVPVRTTEEALIAVSTGRADLAISALASAYHISQSSGLSNLRVAANFDEFEQRMSMAVRPELADLVPLFNTALDAIPLATRDSLRQQWTNVPVDHGVARSTVFFWAFLGTGLLLLMAGWLVFLLSQQRRRSKLLSRAEDAEVQLRAIIESMPALFWMLKVEPGRPAQFILFGQRARDLTGFQADVNNLEFNDVERLMPREDKERMQQLLERHGKSMTAMRFEHRRLGPGLDVVGWSHLQAVPRREKNGITWYGCSIDITDRKTLEVELEQSRHQLAELAAAVPGALWQFRRLPDGQQSYSYMSEGIVAITGRTAEETNRLMMDKSFVSVHPDDLGILQGLMQRLTVQTGIDEARYRLRTAEGGWRWVQVAARAMPVGADGVLVWNGITLDATRIHDTEEALSFERERLQDLTDSFSGALWRMRREASGEFRFDYVSEGIVNLTGRTASEIIENRVKPLESIVEEDQARVAQAFETSIETGRPLEIEYSTLAACGSIERLFARASVRMVDGQPVWTGVLLNVSQRYRLQQQLADARARVEDIASNFPGAIFQMLRAADSKTRFTYVSEGITTLTGRPPRTESGREDFDDFDNIYPEDRVHVQAVSDKLVRDGGSAQFDYRLLDVKGQPRWVHCAMTVRAQSDGSTIINGLLLDAEEAKRLEAELRTATARAEAASRAKGQFLANMSHEIRTPMNAVIGLAHIAMTSETNPIQQERIGKIHKAGKALLKLLNDILEYSRLDAGKFTPVVAAFDLHEINENLRLFCSPAAETKSLTFSIDCDSSVPRHWLGDATRIQQVLLNLLTNAVKFTDVGSVTLSVQTLPAGGGLRFAVRDTGIGMSDGEVKRVFEAFEQASGEIERRHGGSGLGLSISRELVAALGGQLQVESAPGRGTTFIVNMPLQLALPTAPSSKLLADLAPRLHKLASQFGQRDAVGARNSLSGLRVILIPLGRDSELHGLERMLAAFDIEGAQIELARLSARWGINPALA